jgi:hypothetical protein
MRRDRCRKAFIFTATDDPNVTSFDVVLGKGEAAVAMRWYTCIRWRKRAHPQGRETGGPAGAGANQVRNDRQSQDSEGARPRRAVHVARSRRRGDRIECNLLRCICRFLARMRPAGRADQRPQLGVERTQRGSSPLGRS